MTIRTIVLENVWCDESDDFWENEEKIAKLIPLAFESIDWEIKKNDVHVLLKGNIWEQW